MASRALILFHLIATLFLAFLATCHAGSIAVCYRGLPPQVRQGPEAAAGPCKPLPPLVGWLQKAEQRHQCMPAPRRQGPAIHRRRRDASQVAMYLWNRYLGGTSSSRPLGPALDGIDFDIDCVAPQCPFSDEWDGSAIRERALRRDQKDLPRRHRARGRSGRRCRRGRSFWDSPLEGAADTGFIPAGELTSRVLPLVKGSPKYGGVMLWSKFYDDRTGYSSAIRNDV